MQEYNGKQTLKLQNGMSVLCHLHKGLQNLKQSYMLFMDVYTH